MPLFCRSDTMRLFSREWFRALWQGKRPLWEAFWVLGGSALAAAALAGSLLALALFDPVNVIDRPVLAVLLYGVFFALGSIVLVFAWVSIWRCAKNVGHRLWFYLARFLVIAAISAFLLDFLSTPSWFNLGRFLVMAGAAAFFIGFPFKRA